MSFNNIDDIIKESKTAWEEKGVEHRDYATIEEPRVRESVIKTHLTIQQITNRIEHLKGNLIPDLNSLHSYNLMFKKENDRINKELEEKRQELEELIVLREEMQNE